MKFYSKTNVYDASIKRIENLFDEFEEIVVGFSGGKDSTVTLHLALEIAEKRDRLPLKVLFIDQEAEWQGTIDYVKKIMYDKRVEPLWFQMPIVITNNASSKERYSYCWDIKKENQWLHKKDPISIKENIYGTDRFHDLFGAIFKVDFKDKKTCYLAGVRTQEAPKRLMSLTSALTYKDITWGKKLNEKLGHYTFYPIYDWEISDIWKYIYDNNIEYCKIYDEMYKHGVSTRDMRISNLHHETSIQNLLLVQEIEPVTWNKISTRVAGSNAIKHLKNDAFKCPKELPYMFKDWQEYAMHLYDNLISEDKYKENLIKHIDRNKKYIINDLIKTDFYRTIINTILSSDWDFTKLVNFTTSQHYNTVKKYVDDKINDSNIDINRKYNKYIKDLL
jgi:predicted phosphoadenosine phosphosulfate sulfurtransferase